PSMNGHVKNGHAPGKNGHAPRQPDEALLSDPVLLAEALASGRVPPPDLASMAGALASRQTPAAGPRPFDAASTVGRTDAKPEPRRREPRRGRPNRERDVRLRQPIRPREP